MMAGKTSTNNRFWILLPPVLLYAVVLVYGDGAVSPLVLPSDGATFLHKPWSLLTYGFVHTYWRHFATNVGTLCLALLFSAGCELSPRVVFALFTIGVVAGGGLFLIIGDGVLVGSSAGIAALLPVVIFRGIKRRPQLAIFILLLFISFDTFTRNQLGEITLGVHLIGYLVGILYLLLNRGAKESNNPHRLTDIAEKAKHSGYGSLSRQEREVFK